MMTSKSGFAKSLEGEVKKARFSEQQIIEILKLAEAGAKVADLCRKHGISQWTFYQWRNKYGGMNAIPALQGRQGVGASALLSSRSVQTRSLIRRSTPHSPGPRQRTWSPTSKIGWRAPRPISAGCSSTQTKLHRVPSERFTVVTSPPRNIDPS